MNLLSVAGNALGMVTNMIGLKVMNGVSDKVNQFFSRITGGTVSREGFAERAKAFAAHLDHSFPFVEHILGDRPSRLVERLIDHVGESAVSGATRLARQIDSYMGNPSARVEQIFAPIAEHVIPIVDGLVSAVEAKDAHRA